jgi:hypothetical protein
MPNDWFRYEERVAERLSEFVSLILDTLKAPYLFRGHADLDWELEPAIDRSDFSGLEERSSERPMSASHSPNSKDLLCPKVFFILEITARSFI